MKKVFILGLMAIAVTATASPPKPIDVIVVDDLATIAVAELPSLSTFEISTVALMDEPVLIAEASAAPTEFVVSAITVEGFAPNAYALLYRRKNGFSDSFSTLFHNHRKRPYKERGVSPGTCRITGINSSHFGKVAGLRSSLHLRPRS